MFKARYDAGNNRRRSNGTASYRGQTGTGITGAAENNFICQGQEEAAYSKGYDAKDDTADTCLEHHGKIQG